MSDDFILSPEVDVRRALGGSSIALRMLAPYGCWIGYGRLRVLRVKHREDRSVELTVGYDAYRPAIAAPPGAA
ncbi:MAG: hypothetical protein JO030_05200 [Candidatus Eremiobacteraeota bacterium]|nr:hypothetical protein [Candidatus Eremiobacteraeota bacterium]